MIKAPKYAPAGVMPACLLPFKADLTIDEVGLRRHLRDLAATEGVTAIVINAHASEVASCTFDEQKRVFEIAMSEVGSEVPLVHGVYAEGSLEAARIARMAHDGGASALLVFPPSCFSLGHTAEMAITHFRYVADASDLPLIAFEYPVRGKDGYSIETLLKLIEAVPAITAIKDWCGDAQIHETHVRILQAERPDVSVLTAHSAWLMNSLVLGCRGIISGAGSVIAGLQAELFSAVAADKLQHARAISDKIYPLTNVFYTDPWVDMHNRMKEALVLLGKLDSAVVRPPLVKLGGAEINRIRQALVQASLLDVAHSA